MLQSLSKIAHRLLRDFKPPFAAAVLPAKLESEEPRSTLGHLEKLERVVLTDGVGRTLFEEFARHQQSERGHEETGWLLLGLRRETEAVVLATLPAGASRDAGVAHVRFNSAAQMVASRMLRQQERQLGIIGVVHTHPGTLRHPSNGDYSGDSVWVHQLRGREGVFGIGTLEKDEIGPLASRTSASTRSTAGKTKVHLVCSGCRGSRIPNDSGRLHAGPRSGLRHAFRLAYNRVPCGSLRADLSAAITGHFEGRRSRWGQLERSDTVG